MNITIHYRAEGVTPISESGGLDTPPAAAAYPGAFYDKQNVENYTLQKAIAQMKLISSGM